jgi:lysozyme
MTTELERQLLGDEGKRACVYQDHLGYWTIGIGRLVDERVKGAGLRDKEISFLFNNDMQERTVALTERLPWFATLDAARQGVLVNMSFQMGVDGLLAFGKTLSFVKQGAYSMAADQMLKSLWARAQTPKRAERLAAQMRTGVWQFAEGT